MNRRKLLGILAATPLAWLFPKLARAYELEHANILASVDTVRPVCGCNACEDCGGKGSSARCNNFADGPDGLCIPCSRLKGPYGVRARFRRGQQLGEDDLHIVITEPHWGRGGSLPRAEPWDPPSIMLDLYDMTDGTERLLRSAVLEGDRCRWGSPGVKMRGMQPHEAPYGIAQWREWAKGHIVEPGFPLSTQRVGWFYARLLIPLDANVGIHRIRWTFPGSRGQPVTVVQDFLVTA